MKKILCSAFLLILFAGCAVKTSQQAAGTMIGARMGNAVGGIVGGVNDGPRGYFFGSAIGTLVGAAVGNVVNAPRDESTKNNVKQQSNLPLPAAGNYALAELYPELVVRNVTFEDRGGNDILNAGESGIISFEMINRSNHTVYDIYTSVSEVSRMKHIELSAPVRIEAIRPGEGIRYTTAVKSGLKLKDGRAIVQIRLAAAGGEYANVQTLYIITKGK